MNNHDLMLGFYGDDFTGSTDAMEALTLSGIRTVLFLKPPSAELLTESFQNIQAMGIAGVGRSLNPIEMEDELKPVFEALKSSGAPICHYKTCSTFDSSPETGNIGKAIELARDVFGSQQDYIPMVVGVPHLKRYTVFGNHFASIGEETYRLDRHPIMSKHPVTPMDDSDLLNHLKKQTDISSTLIDILDLDKEIEVIKKTVDQKKQNHDLILFDVLDNDRLEKVGQVLSDEAEKNQIFTVGSSGVEYALTRAWKSQGILPATSPQFPDVGKAKPMLVVSGSCSEVTKGQIEYAASNGFTSIRLSGEELLESGDITQSRNRLIEEIESLLSEGNNVVLYSALGPDDLSIEVVKNKLIETGQTSKGTGKFLGEQLGKIAKELIEKQGLSRLVIAGGDTSGYVLKELNVYAMEVIKPITPGGPLCKTYSEEKAFDGVELCLKGGQVGSPDFFLKVMNGE